MTGRQFHMRGSLVEGAPSVNVPDPEVNFRLDGYHNRSLHATLQGILITREASQ